MAENESQNLKLLPYTHFQNRLVTTQLEKNTIKTKLLPIEIIYEPKGTMPNFWKLFWLNEIKYKIIKYSRENTIAINNKLFLSEWNVTSEKSTKRKYISDSKCEHILNQEMLLKFSEIILVAPPKSFPKIQITMPRW